jgi:CRISPR-associated endonuclease/helicase Cas3
MELLSHPKKPLQVHLNGVMDKTQRRKLGNFFTEFSSIYHDIAKTNQHFQNKFNREFRGEMGYSNHSYLSAYIAIHILATKNKVSEYYASKFGVEYSLVTLNILANIISSHHGSLRNIDGIFKPNDPNDAQASYDEVKEMVKFIESDDPIHFIDFINTHYHEDCGIEFPRVYVPEYIKYLLSTDGVGVQWKADPLGYYQTTQFSFAQLIEADKRDASGNNVYHLDQLPYYNATFANNLRQFLIKFKNKAEKSQLNIVRDNVAADAVAELRKQLKTDEENRMFTLAAPTGSGKTFMMLQLAAVIQEAKGDYGIIMSLPFTSIIDQTSAICSNDLLLDVLNYTSVSNNSAMMDKLQSELEQDPEKLKEMIHYNFSEETFDHPFVITTFVQFFETLISNKNSTLLKLPNFSKRIFLIDEYQSIPVNLYTFFYGILQEFCRKNDCYAIFSTATMPKIELNHVKTHTGINVKSVFQNFTKPVELLSDKKYFHHPIFNRYKVTSIGDVTIDGEGDYAKDEAGVLLTEISAEKKSVLVVMNTVKDSVKLYHRICESNQNGLNYNLPEDNIYLLNKNFAPKTRLRIISEVSEKLKRGEHIILVSTQLIEAGVDLDFPIVYRDHAPLPSIIQTAGRCNRNGHYAMGKVVLFRLLEVDNIGYKKHRAQHIYFEFDLKTTTQTFGTPKQETDILKHADFYANSNAEYKQIGRVSKDENLVDHIYKGQIHDLSKYRLVDSQHDVAYFVGDESLWQEYATTVRNKPDYNNGYEGTKEYQIKIAGLRKKMAGDCVNVNSKKSPPDFSDEVLGMRNLADKSLYNEHTGLNEALALDNIDFSMQFSL